MVSGGICPRGFVVVALAVVVFRHCGYKYSQDGIRVGGDEDGLGDGVMIM